MKPKKSPRADLRKRRILFFEAGLIVAITAVAFAFSTGATERMQIEVYEKPIPPPDDLPPVTIQDPPKPIVRSAPPEFISDYYRTVPNSHITANYVFPQDEPIIIDIPKWTEEPLEEIPPIWDPDEMPSFRGGDLNDFRRWVFSQIVYPSMAIDHGIQGRVLVRFVIEKDGSLSNIEVDASPHRTLSDETVRVLKTSPQWTPGKNKGKPVRVYYILPVDYRLSR